jgi:PadR family transcriptional regulator, regulatory protein PadR
MITKDLVAASSRPLVLSILAEGESYGYAIIQRVHELSGEAIEWTDGMLYPVLHRLEREGLIESEWREAETGRQRKYYRLTKAGQGRLQEEKTQWITVHNSLGKLWKLKPVSI